MKKEEAIKYLQQLYPNGGHCWLDEQRIEAIGMAVKALQEEPVSDIDFKQELYKAFGQVKDFTLGMRIAKWFYEMGRNYQEPVSERFAFKAIPRLLEMIEPTDRAKAYIAKLADTLEVEGYLTDAKIVRESLKIMNGEKVAMATMDEKPVSEELEEAAKKYGTKKHPMTTIGANESAYDFKAGAKWQKEQFEKDYTNLCNGIATAKGFAVAMAYDKGMADAREQMMKNIWKPADGDDLPEIDREVVVLIKYNAQRNIHDEEYPTYRVGFGHRPNPDGWDGKNINTNEVTHYTPKLYDNGDWNAPNIVYWLDARLPYEENEIIKEL